MSPSRRFARNPPALSSGHLMRIRRRSAFSKLDGTDRTAMTDRTPTATAAGTPFVGREAELDQLLRALGETVRRRGCLVLVGGEPGIGKSRLADQLAIRAREDLMRVFVGRCWEGVGAPAYWPWVQVFRTIIRTTDDADLRHQLGAGAADIAQIVVELRETLGDLPAAGEVESESARFQLFDSATTFLRRAAKESPLLIIIDDLHAADMPTILYLRFVASQLADAPIMVVCTYREMELAADPALATGVGEIARQPGTLSLSLGGLGEASVRRLIEATAGVSPGSSLVNAIMRETGGNPLFLGEAVRLLAAEGRLGEVATGQALDLPLPAGIRDVIIRRARHLPAETVDLLIHAAALGPEFVTEVLRRVDRLLAGGDARPPWRGEPRRTGGAGAGQPWVASVSPTTSFARRSTTSCLPDVE